MADDFSRTGFPLLSTGKSSALALTRRALRCLLFRFAKENYLTLKRGCSILTRPKHKRCMMLYRSKSDASTVLTHTRTADCECTPRE